MFINMFSHFVSNRCFAVGNYRRKLLGANQPAEFFNPANEKGEAARREMARIAFKEMVDSLLSGVSFSQACYECL